MKIKVVDIYTSPEEVQFGTCDYCFSVGIADNPTFVFETEDGDRFEVEAYEWDWGDYFSVSPYDFNTLEFMIWFNDRNFEVNNKDSVNYGVIEDWVYNFCSDSEPV